MVYTVRDYLKMLGNGETETAGSDFGMSSLGGLYKAYAIAHRPDLPKLRSVIDALPVATQWQLLNETMSMEDVATEKVALETLLDAFGKDEFMKSVELMLAHKRFLLTITLDDFEFAISPRTEGHVKRIDYEKLGIKVDPSVLAGMTKSRNFGDMMHAIALVNKAEYTADGRAEFLLNLPYTTFLQLVNYYWGIHKKFADYSTADWTDLLKN